MKKKHTLKRYVCTDDGSSYGDSYGKPIMEERPEGDYVKFSDIEPLIEAVRFYSDKKNYSMDDYTGISGEMRSFVILYGDREEINDVTSYAGNKARQALKKVGIE